MMSIIYKFLDLKGLYSDPITEQRARGLLYFVTGLGVLFFFVAFYQFATIVQGTDDFSLVTLFFFAQPILAFIFVRIIHAGYYRQTAIAVIAVILLGNLGGLYLFNTVNSLFLALPIIGAAVLLGWRSTAITVGLVITLLLLATFSDTANDAFNVFITTSLVLIGVGVWLVMFETNTQNTARRFIREFKDLRQVTKQLHVRDSQANEEEIALETINLIRDKLNFTFTSIYLIEGGGAVRHILGGLNLQQINIEQNVHLQLGNGISEAIRTTSVVQINKESSAVMREHLLQGIQGALAIPVLDDDQIIAVLDVQSEDTEHFTVNEIDTAVLVAEQLAIGVTQSRLIASLREELDEQNRLLNQQRNRLLNYERSERRATTSAWITYLQQRGIDYMGFDFKEQAIDEALKDSMDIDLETALKTGEISISLEDDVQVVRVPITLRGQALGAMSFRIPKGNQAIGLRQQELIRSVVQRLALALENKRLFEQSHAQAQRESTANEVGNLLLTSTDIDTVLQMAAEHFNEALGAIQTQIHLRPEASQIVEGEDLS